MAPIILTIPELSPSLNRTLRLGHWSKHHRYRKHWSMLVLVAKSDAGVYGTPNFPRALVTVERHGGRTMDVDNLFGSAKAVVDGLRDCGIIADDSPDHITLRVEQHPGGKGCAKRTVVRIEAA